MQEVWKPVVGYEGIYEVSNLGRVKSIPRNGTIKKERYLIPNDNGYGYLKLSLNNYLKTTKYVHILVAESFLNYKSNKGIIVVDHIDSNRKNNILTNLRILSHRENILRSKKSNTDNSNIYKVRNKYRVVISNNHYGYYNSIEEAIEIRDNQLKKNI
jgi:hypothetical protein